MTNHTIQPEIKKLTEKKLVGMHLTMSLTDNKTGMLWRDFMPRRHEIVNRLNNDVISLQVYPENYYQNFNPATAFIKWASAEVKDFSSVPDGMHTLIVPSGEYAIFHYKGSSRDTSIFQYIFSQWLPQSDFVLDHRPHFEILGDRYKNDDPSSEELICIPVKAK